MGGDPPPEQRHRQVPADADGQLDTEKSGQVDAEKSGGPHQFSDPE